MQTDGSVKNRRKRKPASFRMLALLICLCLTGSLVGCSHENKIRIGASSQMSLRLVAWMIEELAERNGIDVELIDVPGGISNLQPPLESGSLQIGVELAQSAWKSVLNKRTVYSAPNLLTLEREYQKRGLVWDPLPMSQDVYTLAISKDLAISEEIETLSDLAEIADTLTLGAPTQYFEDADGYPWMKANYDIQFRTTLNLPTEMMTEALYKGRIDAMPIHTLDGLLRKNELRVLEDDLDTCSGSQLGIVINQDCLLAHPQFMEIFDDLAWTVDADSLVRYGRMVIFGGLSEQEAAMFFLKSKGLITESPDEAGKSPEELGQLREDQMPK